MSSFKQLDTDIKVGGLVDEAQIDEAAAAGVTLIINNLPDGETPGRPDSSHYKAYAESKGINWFENPLVGGQLTPDHISKTIEALATTDGEKLAFCRSGMRSTMLWGLAKAAKDVLTTDEIINKAAEAGYDLAPQRPLFEQVRGQ